MDGWIIFSKLCIIMYIVIKAGLVSIRIQAAFVLLMLFYICVNMALYIIRNKKTKTILFFVNLILLCFGAFQVNNLFFMLLPINIFEALIIYYGKPIYISVVLCMLPVSFINESSISEYVLISLFSFILCQFCIKSHYKIDYLTELKDELREKNYLLRSSRDQDVQYENDVRYLSQLEERNKIAQEIHDKIGHTIAGSLMQLEAAKLLVNKDKETSEKMIQNTIDNLRVGMDNIRITLRNIKPPSEQIGINKIKLIIDEFMLSSNILGVLYYKGDLEVISHKQWNIFQQNIQEALTNVLKYSKASKVNVNIEVLNKFIKCEVKDNGIGNYNFTKGIGISGFEERTEGAGGKVIIDGSNGFSVIFLLPIER